MQSTPEKCESDPIMNGSLDRPRTMPSRTPGGINQLHEIHFTAFRDKYTHEGQVSSELGCTTSAPPVTCFEDRFAWATTGWDAFAPHMKDRLIRNLERMTVQDTFSGMACIAHILPQIVFAVNRHLDAPLPWVPVWSVTEVEPACQVALCKAFHEEFAPRHVFGKVEERLPVPTQSDIVTETPPKDAWTEVKRAKYMQIQELVSTAFRDNPLGCNHSRCHIHDERECPIRPQGFCDHHDLDICGRDLSVGTAGIICKDVSAYGALEGDGGKSMTAQHIAVQERLHAKESLVMMECTKRWNPEAIAKTCQNTYDAYEVLLDGDMIGDIVSRERRLLTMIPPTALYAITSQITINNNK